MINIIFSQQTGCGFYSSCILNPYTHIHSYLNIPDTSGRDSLFQAESRRCKDILDIIKGSDSKCRHLCTFDELYSGTNPEEATKSAYSFLVYLAKNKNVDFILTTHYTSICSRLKKVKNIENWKMDAIIGENDEIKYTYKIKKGVSKIQGAVSILKEMEYPKEILDGILEWK
jgi:DNA mismatch repair ATPase MutS